MARKSRAASRSRPSEPARADPMRGVRRRALPALLAVLLSLAMPAIAAAQIRVLAAGAVQKPVEEIIAAFHAAGRERVEAVFDTVGALRDRVLAGDSADVILLSDAGLEALAARGLLRDGRWTPVGQTTVAICLPAGASAPDVRDAAGLAALLRSAPTIVHADPARGATAGAHFRKVVAALGLEAELAPRITVVPFGGAIAREVAAGRFALGVSQMTEIAVVAGVRGLELPPPHTLRTRYGLALGRAPTPAVEAFAAMLEGEAGKAAFARAGFTP